MGATISVAYNVSVDFLYLTRYPFVVASVVDTETVIVLLPDAVPEIVGAFGTVLSTVAGFKGIKDFSADTKEYLCLTV